MPYIAEKGRKQYDPMIDDILEKWKQWARYDECDVAGDFTYIIYRLLKFFGRRFWTKALGVGCLVCAILEFYRRDVGPYEEEKMKAEGDVK